MSVSRYSFIWYKAVLFVSYLTLSNVSSESLRHGSEFPTANNIKEELLKLLSITVNTSSLWWEVNKSDHEIFNAIRNDRLFLRRADVNEGGGIHSCYIYNHHLISQRGYLVQRTGTFCYPNIIVTGMRKCSTSALYALLVALPNVIGNEIKENCPFIIGRRSIIDYFQSLPKYAEANQVIVDGCVDLQSNLLMREILREPNTFYVVLTRNYADWVWSAYNYWCNRNYDRHGCDSTKWAIPGLHQRSTKKFHEIVLNTMKGVLKGVGRVEGRGGGKEVPTVPTPLEFDSPCTKAEDIYREYVHRLWSKVPREATIVLASEELDLNPHSLWSKLSAASGLPTCHPQLEDFKRVRYNTQDKKGAGISISKSEFKSGVYAISNFEPLMAETRAVLDSCWKSDCLWASNMTGYQYSSCAGVNSNIGRTTASVSSVDVRTDTCSKEGGGAASAGGGQGKSKSRPRSGGSRSSSHHSSDSSKQQLAVPHGYLPRHVRHCIEDFDSTSSSSSTSSSFSSSSSPSSSSSSPSHNTRTSSIGIHEGTSMSPTKAGGKRSQVLLLIGLSLSDRAYVRDLLHVASSRLASSIDLDLLGYDASDPGSKQIISKAPSSSPASTLKLSDEWLTLMNVSCDDARILSLSPNSLEIDGRQSLRIKKDLITGSHRGQCQQLHRHQAPVRAIVLVRDPLFPFWESYRKKTSSLLHFNWTDWEQFASRTFESFNRDSETANRVDGEAVKLSFTDEHVRIFRAFAPADRMFVSMNELIHGDEKEEYLRTIVNFAVGEEQLSPPDRNRVYCARVLSSMRLEQGRSPFTEEQQQQRSRFFDIANIDKRNLDRAYSADYFTCMLRYKLLLKEESLENTGGSSTDTAMSVAAHRRQASACMKALAAANEGDLRTRTCHTRYEKRTFIPLQEIRERQPTAFYALPGKEAETTRLLIEHASAIYTGTETSNKTLNDVFPAEGLCGMRLAIVYTDPRNVTIRLTKRGGNPTISVTNAGRAKCMRGLIRGFSRAVILVRDPFASLWYMAKRVKTDGNEDAAAVTVAAASSVAVQLPLSTSSTSLSSSSSSPYYDASDKKRWKLTLSRLARSYRKESELFGGETYFALIDYMMKIFDMKNIMFVSYEYLLHSETHEEAVLQILDYLKLRQSTTTERLQCARQFIDSADINSVDTMVNEIANGGNRFICSLQEVLSTRIGIPSFSGRLFMNKNCSRTL